ncbi:hypothetical protein [Planctobacterium marinum]|uniref:hypothetical protein n=1 Tax=Planctobacterium marinum TaxID=1631968 RepID=UPI001E4C417F|nr:hypothetical protein [Planctobacterium marinum]MCC2605977.1 hypothetical protein [Planctobacterium marinum]
MSNRPANIRHQTPEQRVDTYRRAQAKSLGNEYSRRNAENEVKRQQNPSPGLQRLANRRAPSQTVLVEARQAKFSQQSVTANFSMGPTHSRNNIDQMANSMQQSGFDRRHGSMKGSLVKNEMVSHDNRRLVAAKTADIWVPMKLEHPSVQNIDMSSQEKSASSAQRPGNTVNNFLIERTSPSKREPADPQTAQRGYSQGFDQVHIKSGFAYEGGASNKSQGMKQRRKVAEDALIGRHQSIAGKR